MPPEYRSHHDIRHAKDKESPGICRIPLAANLRPKIDAGLRLRNASQHHIELLPEKPAEAIFRDACDLRPRPQIIIVLCETGKHVSRVILVPLLSQ
jgi:hypothetical protein